MAISTSIPWIAEVPWTYFCFQGRSDLNEMQRVKVSNEQKLKEELAELEKQFKSIN